MEPDKNYRSICSRHQEKCRMQLARNKTCSDKFPASQTHFLPSRKHFLSSRNVFVTSRNVSVMSWNVSVTSRNVSVMSWNVSVTSRNVSVTTKNHSGTFYLSSGNSRKWYKSTELNVSLASANFFWDSRRSSKT
jgi:hypothetical protein